jgi:ferredoxin-thioredoxin reductase catalytic subunit
MKPNELYEMLRKTQEPKGYFFNQDMDKVLALLAGLLENKERYGYMGCPCRLLCGNRDWDQDIICPCWYREGDVKEYGSCYCSLYVSREWNNEGIPHDYVPERRPVAKILGPDLE